MKRWFWLLGCFVVVFIYGCTGTVEKGENKDAKNNQEIAFEVTLPDSGVEMTISKLPAGISKEDISIEPIDPIQFGVTTDIQETDFQYGIRGFDLQPDGAVFDEPVMVTIPFEGEVPFYFHLHDGEVSSISGLTYIITDTGSVAMLPLTSFSQVIEWQNGTDAIDIELDVHDSYVGEPVPIKAVISFKDEIIRENDDIVDVIGETSTIQGTIFGKNAKISPGSLDNVPPRSKFNKTYAVDLPDQFVCEFAGEEQVEYWASVLMRVNLTHVGAGVFGTDLTIENRPARSFLRVSKKITCHPRRKPIEPPEERCGDGVIQGAEECDGTNLRYKSCRDFGYEYGILGCTEYCEYDKSDCEGRPLKISCSNNTRESYNEYTEDGRGKQCSDDCPGMDKCDAKTCTCISYDEWQEKIYGKPKVNRDRVLHPEKYPKLPTTKKVKVIKYGMGYIPTDKLTKAKGDECDKEEHRHAHGEAVGLNGWVYTDPDGTGCGFGKTSEVPEIEIDVPLTEEEKLKLIQEQDAKINPPQEEKESVDEPLPGLDDDDEVEGEMIQIDPPSIVIPAG